MHYHVDEHGLNRSVLFPLIPSIFINHRETEYEECSNLYQMCYSTECKVQAEYLPPSKPVQNLEKK